MKKPINYAVLFLLLLFSGIRTTELKAQCSILSTAVPGPTLQCASGTGNRSGVAFNPIDSLYYSVNAGSGSYPIETFAYTGGTSVASTAAGISYRGLWWNSGLSQLEGNGISTTGLRKQDLDVNGYALGTGISICSGQNQPNTQSCGDLDYQANEVIYYDNGSIYRYDRSTCAALGNYPLNNMPVATANILLYGVIYTGCPGNEVGIYDHVNKAVHLFDKATGNFSTTVNLPASAPAPTSFGFSFANDMVWIFESGSLTWRSYSIFQNCTPPVAQATALGATSFCAGDSVVLYSDTSTSVSYQWLLNGVTIPGATSGSYSADTSGTYAVVVSNGCSDTSAAVVVTLLPAPNAGITANGSATFCDGDSVQLVGSGGSSYQWYLDGSPIGGATGMQYNATMNGAYTVLVSDSSGCSAISQPLAVSVLPLPNAGIQANGAVAFCDGDSVQLEGSGGTSYQWYLDGVLISGATGMQYTATTGGNYSVMVTDSSGCAASSADETVTVHPNPTPVITQSMDSLLTGMNYSTYQWLESGSNVSGANMYYLVPGQSGVYAVMVTDSNGCSGISDTLNFNFVSVSPSLSETILLYPNPASSVLRILLDGEGSGPVSVRIFNLNGAMVREQTFVKMTSAATFEIPLDGLTSGMYGLKLSWYNRSHTLKFVKQ